MPALIFCLTRYAAFAQLARRGLCASNGYEQLPVVVQSRLGTVPLVSLINEVNGEPLSFLAGSAVARANRTDLNTLEDINNQRVSA